MNNFLLRLYTMSQALKNNENGQDMVEYALVVALISLAATSAVSGVSSGIVVWYSNVSNALSS
jgi:pilus assembly protein Flp/PilA